MDYSGTLKLEEAIDDLGHSLIPPLVEGEVAPNFEVFGNLREGTTSHWEVGALSTDQRVMAQKSPG